MENLYPLKFELILKKTIWGGKMLSKFKNLENDEDGIGESWEISQIPGSVSVISNGILKGRTLTEVIDLYGKDLTGKSNLEHFGKKFPLLLKFIDANKDLSIQVHPDDALAKKRYNTNGKTEMWYVIDRKPGAKLVSGFIKDINKEEYIKYVEDGKIEDIVKYHEVNPGDVFFLPAGRVHAIGSGIFLAEIQQSSDITYRIYDYNRTDSHGKKRELHTELAVDAIDYTYNEDVKKNFALLPNESVELVKSKFFTTNRIYVKKKLPQPGSFFRSYLDIDSFVSLICIKGEGEIKYGKESMVSIKKGETVLIPACIKNIELRTDNELLLLETYV